MLFKLIESQQDRLLRHSLSSYQKGVQLPHFSQLSGVFLRDGFSQRSTDPMGDAFGRRNSLIALNSLLDSFYLFPVSFSCIRFPVSPFYSVISACFSISVSIRSMTVLFNPLDSFSLFPVSFSCIRFPVSPFYSVISASFLNFCSDPLDDRSV